MSLNNLLQGVEDRTESIKLAIDADGILFLSCYGFKDKEWNVELAYFDFCGRIKSIERECYSKANEVKDIKLCFSAKGSFKKDIYEDYKGNRKAKATNDLTDKQKLAQHQSLELKTHTLELKKLIYQRIKGMAIANNEVEADELVLMYAKQGYVISAMDSDVVGQCTTPVFNFHSKHWKWTHQGLTDSQIIANTIIDTIKGKTKDNVKGVTGKGEVFANNFIRELDEGTKTFMDWIELYDIPSEALLAYRLCSTRQYEDGKLKMVEIEDIELEFANAFSSF